MMHRGDLAEHAVGDLLRTAGAERLSGGIELDGGSTVCIYLDDGAVYLVALAGADVGLTVDDAQDDATWEAARQADEARLRAESVRLLAEALDRREGWYFYHHLTEHEAQGLWAWSAEELLEEASAGSGPDAVEGPAEGAPSVDGRPPAPGGPGIPTDGGSGDTHPSTAPPEAADGPERSPAGRWRLGPTPPEGLDATTWAVLVAAVGSIDPTEVVARLGWPTEQAQTALGSLVSQGLLVPEGQAADRELIGGRVRRLDR